MKSTEQQNSPILDAATIWAQAWGAVWENSEDDNARDALNDACKSLYDAICEQNQVGPGVALLRRADSPTEKWQPIETAPKDEVILAGFIDHGFVYRVSDAHWNRTGWFNVGGVSCHWATHWMPLPSSPQH